MRGELILLLVCWLFVELVCCNKDNLQIRPVIGILTQPTDSAFVKLGKSYLPASYVKWLEAAGAKVVPIPWDASTDTLKAIFHTINGLLLPGGNIDLPGSKYLYNSNYLYNLTIEANNNGDFFPLWGTCQGFEELAVITSGNSSILSHFYSEDLALSLTFTPYAKSSNMFKDLPEELFDTLQTETICENLHELGVSPVSFINNQNLLSFYNILATNLDRQGNPFISVIEAKQYPIYGVQWHPERNQFEWDENEPIDSSDKAVQSVFYLATFFVSQAKLNQHTFTPIQYNLIHHYTPTYTLNVDPYYVQSYFWN